MGKSTLIKVLIAMVLAVAAGLLTGTTSGIGGVTFFQIYDLIGRIFLNALTLVVIPLVTASIITGTARIGGEGAFGVLGAKTFGFFILTNFLAILVGWTLVNLFVPGLQEGLTPQADLSPNIVAEITEKAPDTGFGKFANILFQIIPANIFAAAAKGQMLGMIFFSFLFGYFMTKIEAHHSSILISFWQGIFQTMMKITHFVMKALPIGVFALVAKVIASTGFNTFASMGWYFVTILLALGIFMLIILPALLYFFGRVNPLLHIQAMSPALLTAFSTSSSAATLPVTIESMEKRAGVSNRIVSFTIPLGTAMNLAGSALHVCVSVIFIAQVYGLEITPISQILIIIMTLLMSMGMAGVPSASLIAIVVILGALGMPAEGIGLLIPLDRIIDMFRTMVNVFTNSCSSVLVARSEGERTHLVKEVVV